MRALLLLLVAGLVGFALLAAVYAHEPVASVDAETAEWVATNLPGWVEWLARPFSWLGGWVGLTALGVAAGVYLAVGRAWLDLAFFLVVFVGSQLAVSVLKDMFDRTRPDAGSAVPLPESAAFPSGHAAAGAASLGAVAVLVADRLESSRERGWLWAATVVVGICVGSSRIALNVHFVTDVVAGWCFGLAWLAGCLLARDALRAENCADPR